MRALLKELQVKDGDPKSEVKELWTGRSAKFAYRDTLQFNID